MTTLRSAAALCGVAALVALTPGAATAAVPYSDPAARGVVGLCDQAGHPVTHGSIRDKPFVWRAVSSTRAPAGYDGAKAKATLLAYQPRPQTPAEQWSGDTLTSTSSYTNPAYPMAQATPLDFTLEDFLAEFPPMVDGLIQLRMYFGSPESGTLNTSYPATNIKISGDSWSTVDGASLPCTKGTAESSETITGRQASGQPASAGASGSGRRTTAPPARTTASGRAAPTASAQAATAPSGTTAAAAAERQHGSDSPAVPIAIAAGVALAATTGAGYWWRRRANHGS